MVAGILKVPFPVLILQSKLKAPIKSGFFVILHYSHKLHSPEKKTTKMKRGHFNASICDDSVNVSVTYILFLL